MFLTDVSASLPQLPLSPFSPSPPLFSIISYALFSIASVMRFQYASFSIFYRCFILYLIRCMLMYIDIAIFVIILISRPRASAFSVIFSFLLSRCALYIGLTAGFMPDFIACIIASCSASISLASSSYISGQESVFTRHAGFHERLPFIFMHRMLLRKVRAVFLSLPPWFIPTKLIGSRRS